MFNSFQRLSAAAVFVATLASAGASTTDINITVKNSLGIAVVVTIDSKDSTVGAGDEQKTGAIGMKGRSVHWKAKPSNESDKSKFTTCEGDATISDKGVIVLEKGSHTKCDAAAASKPPVTTPKIIRVEAPIAFTNKSQHEADLYLFDLHVSQRQMTITIPVNGTYTFQARLDEKATLDVRVALHCKRPGEKPPYSVDSHHYATGVGSVEIHDVDPNDDSKKSSDPILCRMTP